MKGQTVSAVSSHDRHQPVHLFFSYLVCDPFRFADERLAFAGNYQESFAPQWAGSIKPNYPVPIIAGYFVQHLFYMIPGPLTMNSLLSFSKCHAAEAVHWLIKGPDSGVAHFWYSRQPALHVHLVLLNIMGNKQGHSRTSS
jgi:hypothetical protein